MFVFLNFNNPPQKTCEDILRNISQFSLEMPVISTPFIVHYKADLKKTQYTFLCTELYRKRNLKYNLLKKNIFFEQIIDDKTLSIRHIG